MGANSRWVDSKIAAKASIAALAPITVTASAGSLPTPGGTVTIANTATPTVVELLDYCTELKAKLDAVVAGLQNTNDG